MFSHSAFIYPIFVLYTYLKWKRLNIIVSHVFVDVGLSVGKDISLVFPIEWELEMHMAGMS